MRLVIAALTVSSVVAMNGAAHGQSSEQITNRLNNLSHEFIHCSAFFYVVANGLKRRSDPNSSNLAQKYIRHGDRLRDIGGLIGLKIGQKPEVIKVRWEMSVKSLWAEMDNHFKNFSLLLSKYLNPCVDLIKNPERHVQAAVSGQRLPASP